MTPFRNNITQLLNGPSITQEDDHLVKKQHSNWMKKKFKFWSSAFVGLLWLSLLSKICLHNIGNSQLNKFKEKN